MFVCLFVGCEFSENESEHKNHFRIINELDIPLKYDEESSSNGYFYKESFLYHDTDEFTFTIGFYPTVVIQSATKIDNNGNVIEYIEETYNYENNKITSSYTIKQPNGNFQNSVSFDGNRILRKFKISNGHIIWVKDENENEIEIELSIQQKYNELYIKPNLFGL